MMKQRKGKGSQFTDFHSKSKQLSLVVPISISLFFTLDLNVKSVSALLVKLQIEFTSHLKRQRCEKGKENTNC